MVKASCFETTPPGGRVVALEPDGRGKLSSQGKLIFLALKSSFGSNVLVGNTFYTSKLEESILRRYYESVLSYCWLFFMVILFNTVG